jgi:hypothetical protein
MHCRGFVGFSALGNVTTETAGRSAPLPAITHSAAYADGAHVQLRPDPGWTDASRPSCAAGNEEP